MGTEKVWSARLSADPLRAEANLSTAGDLAARLAIRGAEPAWITGSFDSAVALSVAPAGSRPGWWWIELPHAPVFAETGARDHRPRRPDRARAGGGRGACRPRPRSVAVRLAGARAAHLRLVPQAHDAGARRGPRRPARHRTGRAFAGQVGLPASQIVTGEEIERCTPATLRELALTPGVLVSRVSPAQKLAVVRALREADVVVAVTGDMLLAGIAAELALMLALIYVPPLARAFGMSPPLAAQWRLLLFFPLVVLMAEELRKWAIRHTPPRGRWIPHPMPHAL